jgi:hypothetical protein
MIEDLLDMSRIISGGRVQVLVERIDSRLEVS